MRARGVPSRWFLFSSFVASAAALVLGVAPSAQATTNIVPNPGFEMDCAGVPCSWLDHSVGTTVVRDTSTFHAGAASIKVSGAAGVSNEAKTGCLPMSLAPGTHADSFWFNNSDPDVSANNLRLEVDFYSTSNCSALISIEGLEAGSQTGGWFQSTGGNVVPPNTAAVIFDLIVPCFVTGPCSANFDDVDFENEILAVTLTSFRAARAHKGVLVRWRTGSEVDTLGFNVYRQHNGHRVRVNRRLIPALSVTRGGISGGAYSYIDGRAPRHAGLRYWLQEVDTSGHRTWHGPVHVGPS